MKDIFTVPREWGLSPQQEFVIGSLIDSSPRYLSADHMCRELYEEECPGPAPAKLRVLMMRCREIVEELTNGKGKIQIRRNKGWWVSEKTRKLLTRA